MSTKKLKKKKLCWNCEGQVSFQQENCTFCGVYLNPLDEAEKEDALFAPPYRLEDNEDESQIPLSPYANREEAPSLESQPTAVPHTESTSLIQGILIPLVLLLSGSVFLIFSLALMLFARKGLFTLHWDGTYWFIYLIAGVFMLGFGAYTLQNLKEDKIS